MTAKSVTPNRHNNINEPPLLWAVFYWSKKMNITPLFICKLLKREPISPWKELIDSLENNPFDWVTNSCTVDNNNNKTRFWIGNGYLYFKIYPGELKIPISQRYRVYKAVNEVQAARFKSNK